MADLTPLVMTPVLAAKPWGGRRLAAFGKRLPGDALFGESWEIADLPAEVVTTVSDPRSRVESGAYAGRALHELIAEFGAEFMGCASPTVEGDFPLLVKLLDAREHLSVQVHPDKRYVKRHPEARLKTESWYVVDAAPGSHVYLGLRAGVTADDVAAAVGTAAFVQLLEAVPARPGDFHHLPAGLVHALGAGVFVAEVQTPSDTTFRIYDWEDRYDRPDRQMHHDAALEAIRPELRATHLPRPEGAGSRDLVATPHYWIREHRGDGGAVAIDSKPEVRILLIVAGSAVVDGDRIPLGATVVLPAAMVPATTVVADPGAVVLEVGLV